MRDIDQIVKKFDKNGFVVIRSVLSQKKITFYLNEINRLTKKLVNNYKRPYVNLTKDNKVNTGHNLNVIFPKSPLMKLYKNKKILSVLKKLYNEEMEMRNLEVFLKPPKTGMKAPFHQDNYYWNIKDKRAVNLWIALDKVEKKNGGLIYYSGSHNRGVFKHKLSKTKGTSQELDNRILTKMKHSRVSPKLNPGDCIMHHCEVIHGSNANNTNKNRRAIVISMKTKSSKVDKKKFQKYQSNLKKHIKKNLH